LSAGISELDDADDYRSIMLDLTREKDPQGPLETFLVESAALDTEVLHPPVRGPSVLESLDRMDDGTLVDPGLPATMRYEGVQRLVSTFQRYETAIDLKLFRTLHELERTQRMRVGEKLPAPVAVDITLGVNGSKADEPVEKTVLEGSLSKHHAEAETAVAEQDEATDVPPVEN
jgi:hypothetical protein